MQHVTVLMSSYNGERFVGEQVESILNQTGVRVKLVVRDDGSSDNTVKRIEDICVLRGGVDEVEITRGQNIGVYKSFEQLVLDAPEDDWYAFADQDDIWDSDKLSTAVSFLSGIEQPALYYHNQIWASDDGKPQGVRMSRENLTPSFINVLFKGYYPGCAMVFNHALMEKIRQVYRTGGEEFSFVHDSLALITAQLVGVTVYDPKPRMKYRRHSNTFSNSTPYDSLQLRGKFKYFTYRYLRIKKYMKSKGYLIRFCKAMENALGGELDPHDLADLRYIRSYTDSLWNWLGFLLRNRLRRYFPAPALIAYAKIFLRLY